MLENRIKRKVLDLKPCIHGARLSEGAEASGKREEEMLDFSVSLNPLGMPNLKSILANAYKSISCYPDNRYPGFKKAAAERLNVLPENIVPGNGSSELIRLFAEAVLEQGDTVIIPSPTFGEYELQCKLFGTSIEHIDYKNITKARVNDCKAVFLCNPNNPTGNLLRHKEVLRLAEICASKEVFLFVDEAFIELSAPEESVSKHAASNDFLVVLRSLTKTFSVPGLRIGFIAASSNLAGILNNLRLPWNLNSIASVVGEHLLKKDQKYILKSLELIKRERDWLNSKLKTIRGFKLYPSDANFILIDLKEFALSSKELTERMLGKGVIIRECASFGLENHIRIAVRKRNENLKLIKALSSVISEWGGELAEKEIGKALERGAIARSRVECEYYPCHFLGQDCTFCFCPFYPCLDKRTCGEFVLRTTGGKVWSCAKCKIIHRAEVADRVLKELMIGRKIGKVWELVMEPVL